MKRTLIKDSIREIRNTFKRFLSILLIVFLGVGFFAGIKAASPDMKETVDVYFDQSNMYDIEVISTMGIKEEDLEALRKIEKIEEIAPSYSVDALVHTEAREVVVKLQSLLENVNQLTLIEGRMPEKDTECVVEEGFLLGSKYKIGDTITVKPETLEDEEGNEKSMLKNTDFTIVGTVQSPLYISRARGAKKLGSGKIEYVIFLPNSAIDFPFYTEVYLTVKEAKTLKTYGEEYKEEIENVKKQVETIGETRRQERYEEIVKEAQDKIEEAQTTLQEEKEKAEKEIKDAENKLEEGKKEIENSKKEVTTGERKAKEELKNANQKLIEAEKQLQEGEKQFATAKPQAEEEIQKAEKNLQSLQELKKQYDLLEQGIKEIKKQITEVEEQIKGLNTNTQQEQIAILQMQLNSLKKELQNLEGKKQQLEGSITANGITPNAIVGAIEEITVQIAEAKNTLKRQEETLVSSRKELEQQKQTFESNKKQTETKLANAKRQIQEGEREIADNETKIAEAKKEAEAKIQEAQIELDNAKDKIKEIKKPEWYFLTREENQGYVEYIQDSDRIANIGKVFPIVFFVVAALISLTSMTRMVEEQRGQIGTLKALGYNKMQIAGKYIVYASLATILGSVLGMLIGFQLLPKIVLDMYAMMYTLPIRIIEFNMYYAITGLLAALLCTVGATAYTCTKELLGTPAKLMRPKAPKPGKRVFLEKISFIWSRLKFTQKVTVRNIFRYKKRFLMTIIGVMGCTSLIVAGFALRDAISSMIPSQYGEIFNYQLQISIQDEVEREKIEEEAQKILQKEKVTDILKVNMQAITIEEPNNNQDIQLIVPEDIEKIQDFIHLKNRRGKEESYFLNDKEVILTEKLANLLNLKKGDSIKIKNNDEKEVEVTIGAITENYLLHYIYMSPKLYQTLYGENVRFNVFLGKTEEMEEQEEKELAQEILENKEVISGISILSSTKNIFEEVMGNMDFVVWILIVSAGLLAFTVLYNLSNVNISERIRELATIKVLGFYDKEVYKYVTRETVILTIIGILLGLIMGYFLSLFIIKTCELDMLMFDIRMKPHTFLYGTVITLVFAGIVNIATYFSLKKIDMIESLKSVE